MTPKQFHHWRKSLNLKQREAAELLGLKKRMIQYYEHGRRGGKAVHIPKTVRLACLALTQGARDFDGETATRADDHPPTPAISVPVKAGAGKCRESSRNKPPPEKTPEKPPEKRKEN
ncbi:MAG: helix-turn-helix domain-containing protein [Alphaproteobacteria bacterium]